MIANRTSVKRHMKKSGGKEAERKRVNDASKCESAAKKGKSE